MNKARRLALSAIWAAAAATLAGCSTAGPFVTTISSDGKGNLIVQKNIVHVNGFTGMISMGDNPTTETVKVLPESGQQTK